jgi:hypothetical protein
MCYGPGVEDYSEAQRVLVWLVEHSYADSFDAALQRADRDTRDFLRQRWPAIVKVAEALRERGRLEAHEVVKLCE